MSTTSELKQCPKCGEPIPAEAPQGLCPKCLFAQASIPTDAANPAASKLVPPSREELAAAFPQLEILELIGQGGMGFVFKVRQPKLERFVALKILPQSFAADPAFAERFTREGRLLARLNHPNIVTIHDFGQAGGFFYLLMEFVDGLNLRQAMRAGRFTPEQALVVVPKICDALQFAHNEGILHRDIKPENILIDSKGRVKIADFGIAKLIGEPHSDAHLTASGGTLGTPHYMAPEQIEKPSSVDNRADIYSLGVVFYEMLTGELPLGKFQPPSQKVHVDVRLDDVVLHALEKEPARRYQQVSEVKTAVDTIAAFPPSHESSDSRSKETPSSSSEQSRGLASTAAIQTASSHKPDRFWKWFAVGLLALIAIPIAIAILGLLAAIVIPNFQRARAVQAEMAAREHARAAQAEMAARHAQADSPLSSTPVVEIVLGDVRTHERPELLNFETGQQFSIAELFGSKRARLDDLDPNVLRSRGIDIAGNLNSDSPGIVSWECAFHAIGQSGWTAALEPAAIQAGWDKSLLDVFEELPTPAPGERRMHSGEPPQTWLLKTRTGCRVVLQITGFTENPRGVKIRYKLLPKTKINTQGVGVSAESPTLAEAKRRLAELRAHGLPDNDPSVAPLIERIRKLESK